jgi:hypothetical protein
MTTTARLAFPRHRTAVALLHRIAGVIFNEAMKEPEPQATFMDAWWELRKVAERIDARGSLDIPAVDREAMLAAFQLVPHAKWIPMVNRMFAEETA